MLKFYICEDNLEQRNRFLKYVEDTIIIEELDIGKALITEDPEEILEYLSMNQGTGIYFLDVDLKNKINGIQLAEKIREYDPSGFIIFITTHAEMSYLTFRYKVEAMDYIIKENYKEVKDRIHKCILNAHSRYSLNSNQGQKIFKFVSDDKVIHIENDKILYFETSSTIHKIIIHAIDRQVEFYGQMKDIEEQLEENFCRCHRSYIVNKDKIKEIHKKERIIYMINGETCMISTRGMRLLKEFSK